MARAVSGMAIVLVLMSLVTGCGARGGKSPVHPNDAVNMGQSSNDVIPTAIHVSASEGITKTLIPELNRLRAGQREQAVQEVKASLLLQRVAEERLDRLLVVGEQNAGGAIGHVEEGYARGAVVPCSLARRAPVPSGPRADPVRPDPGGLLARGPPAADPHHAGA